MSSSSSLPDEPEEATMSIGRRIRRCRLSCGWSLQQLAQHIRRAAAKRGAPAPAEGSLKLMISRWENNHFVPSQQNRRLLADAMGVQVGDLGLSVDPDFPW